MKNNHVEFLVFFILLVNCKASSNDVSKTKVQIGVKRRPLTCPLKSRKGDLLHVFYQGTLQNGEEFDNNFKDKPFTFTLGSGQVIKGWDQGLIGMCIGEQRKLLIPPNLAYGSRGVPPKIPPDETLRFLVELTKIERRSEL